MLTALGECFHRVQEIILSFLVTIYDGLSWVLRECRILDYELMEIVSQKVGTGIASMAIKDAEEAALWPIVDILL